MKHVELFHPCWSGEKINDRTTIIFDQHSCVAGYVRATGYSLPNGHTRVHIEDINITQQGVGLGGAGMKLALQECRPGDQVTGEVLDVRALKILRKLFTGHVIHDIWGNRIEMEQAISGMESNNIRKLYVLSKVF